MTTRGLGFPSLITEHDVRFQLGYVADPRPGHEFYKGCLSIPYLRWSHTLDEWSVVSIRFRRLDGGDPKYMSVSGDRTRLYNTRALLSRSSTIAISEGECLRGDAEVLTPEGWVRFDRYEPGMPVAQYELSGNLRFVTPNAYIKKSFKGQLVERRNRQRYYHLSTPGHRVPAFGGKREPYLFTTAGAGHWSASIPRVGLLDGPGIPLTDSEIRLRIAVSADASIRTEGYTDDYFVFGFKKQRKIERLRKILADVGIQASDNPISGGYTSICFSAERGTLRRELPAEWITQASLQQRMLILDELVLWDGNLVPNRDQFEYSSKHLYNAQWVQTLAHTSGMVSTIIPRSNQYGDWYKVSVLRSKSDSSWQSLQDAEDVYHDGDVYCVSVPSSAFLVRMGGCISVTGNCDAISAEACGIPCVGLPGAESWKPHFKEPFLGYLSVFVFADGDDAGRRFANTVAQTLPNAKVIPCEPGQDINSLFVQRGRQALIERLK